MEPGFKGHSLGTRLVDFIAIELNFPSTPSSSRNFDSINTTSLIFSGTIKILYLLPFSKTLMRKIQRKDIAISFYSMITQDLLPLLLFFQPVPFPLIVWQLFLIHGVVLQIVQKILNICSLRGNQPLLLLPLPFHNNDDYKHLRKNENTFRIGASIILMCLHVSVAHHNAWHMIFSNCGINKQMNKF